VTWKYDGPAVHGFRVYRNGLTIDNKILPASQHSFSDVHQGEASYSVSAIDAEKNESPLSVRTGCMAGSSDSDAPIVVVISPPTSSPVGQPLWIKARVLDDRAYDDIKADLFYRAIGEEKWKRIPMDRKVKAVFAAAVPRRDVTGQGIEYYIESTDGANKGFFPAPGSEQPLSLVTFGPATSATPDAPSDFVSNGGTLIWKSGGREAYWHRIYRSKDPDFKSGPATFVTFVAAGTTSFKDNGEGFDGAALKGDWYYRITSVNKDGTESEESPAAKVTY
jgi:hypothetical protein